MRWISLGLVAALALMPLAPPAGAQDAAKVSYFFVTSDPVPFEQAISPIYQARVKSFDNERVHAAYSAFLRRTIGAGWFKYAHHAHVHGPFGSMEAAQAEQRRQAGPARTTRPRELFGFRYFDVSAVLTTIGTAVVQAPLAAAPPSAPAIANRPLIAGLMLEGIPMTIYTDREWVWDRASASDLTASVEELRPTAALIWVDPKAHLDPSTSEAKELRAAAASALRHKLIAVVLLPGRAMDTLPLSLKNLQADIAGQGGRLELVADDTSDPSSALQHRVRQLLPLTIPSLRINELMANNRTAVKGPAGDFPDWIEIVNLGSEAIDLSGMYLTDRRGSAGLRRIASSEATKTTVQPGQRVVLWIDGRASARADHISFKLSSRGERVTLFDSDGVSIIDQVEFGVQAADKSYARVPDGTGKWLGNQAPSPGEANKASR